MRIARNAHYMAHHQAANWFISFFACISFLSHFVRIRFFSTRRRRFFLFFFIFNGIDSEVESCWVLCIFMILHLNNQKQRTFVLNFWYCSFQFLLFLSLSLSFRSVVCELLMCLSFRLRCPFLCLWILHLNTCSLCVVWRFILRSHIWALTHSVAFQFFFCVDKYWILHWYGISCSDCCGCYCCSAVLLLFLYLVAHF